MSIVLRIGAVQHENAVQKMATGTGPGSMDASPAPEDVYTYHPPQQTYSSCFGLPYQDHNYGAPPPPTPPQSPPPTVKVNGHIDVVEETVNIVVAKAVSELNQAAGEGVDDSITRCICDYQHDDGYMICCDKCSVWQHIDCMNIDRNNIPDAYSCEQCEPRIVDKQRARDLQTRKREEMTDSSATDTDPDEAAHHLALLKAQANANKKGKTKKNLKKDISKDGKPKKLKKEKEKRQERKEKKSKLANTNSVDVSVTVSKMKLQNNKENAKKPAQLKQPSKKSRSVDFQVEDARDAWNSSVSPWVDGYEPARNNHYSSALQEILSVNKFNGQHADEVKKAGELKVQLCCVSEVKKNRKGLKAVNDIHADEAIIEYVGRVMLKNQYDSDNIFFKMLHPFVLFYSKFDNTNLCIDASNYGNDARFVRRSCSPNAEVRHVVSAGSIRFYIFSTREIPKGTEITIPFDYQYKDCSFNVECPCSKINCVVSKKKRKRSNAQARIKPETSPVVCRTSKRCLAQKAKEQAMVKEESSVSAVGPPDTSFLESLANAAVAVSMAEQSMSELPTPSSDESPQKLTLTETQELGNTLCSANTVEGEIEDQSAESEKKLTREERKMQAIMKAFEKLEKREERRKEALARLEVAKKVKVEKSQSEEWTETSTVAEVKQEQLPEQKAQKGKRRKSHPARRRSRVSSGNSECTVGSEDSNMGTPASAPTTPSPNVETGSARCPNSADKNFRYKTKRHLMNEWLSEKTQAGGPVPVAAQTTAAPTVTTTSSVPAQLPNSKIEPLEVNVEETMFVTCLPSPRNTLEHMRRNSHSSGDKSGQGCSIGSAKKRWLRQAMCESTQSSDSGKESPAPYCDGTSPNHTATIHSPGGSPAVDFVTPLKKRRLARESLSADQPPTPSTLSPPLPSMSDDHTSGTQSQFMPHEVNRDSAPVNVCTGTKVEGKKVEELEPDMSLDTEVCGSAEQKEQPMETQEPTDLAVDSSIGREISGETLAQQDLASSSEHVTDSASVVKDVAEAEVPVPVDMASNSVLPQSSLVEASMASVDAGDAGVDSKVTSDVVSSDNVSVANVDKDRICSSTEMDASSPVCSADTSTWTAVNSHNAQITQDVESNQLQPSSTASLDSSVAVNDDVSLESQGSRLCDSAEASSFVSGAVNEEPVRSAQGADRTTLTCDGSVVSGSSRDQDSGNNLHVESSCVVERPEDSSLHSEGYQPAYDSLVSSTSQAFCSDRSREANETFSPGVSSTVSDLQRDQVSSVSGEIPRVSGGGEAVFPPLSACDSSVGHSVSTELPAAAAFHSSRTVMSADSTSTAPPPPPPHPPPLPPQPPPPPPVPAKKKVSLLEYRKRLKEKGSGTSSNCTPTKSMGSSTVTPSPGRTTPTLAPLPFFDPGSPSRQDPKDGISSPVKKDEDVRWSGRQREKPLSLTERLRMEFGLDDSDEEETSPDKKPSLRETSQTPPPPPPPSGVPPPPPGTPMEVSRVDSQTAGHVPCPQRPGFSHHDPRTHGLGVPQPVPPPAGQSLLGPPAARIPSLMSLQAYPTRPHQPHPNTNHLSPRTASPHVFSQSPPPPPPGSIPKTAAPHKPVSYQGSHASNHVGQVNNSSRLPANHHPAVYSTPSQAQRAAGHTNQGFSQSNGKSNYSTGPQRQRSGSLSTYNHSQYSAHTPTRPPAYSGGVAPPTHPPPGTQPYPGKPLSQPAASSVSTQSQPYSSRTSSSFTTHSYNHKNYY